MCLGLTVSGEPRGGPARGLSLLVMAFHVLVSVAFAGILRTEQAAPRKLAPGVWGVLEEPGGMGPHPGVVLLHGSTGWQPAYADVARVLADSGFVALALDYYAEAGPSAIRSKEKIEKWPAYQSAVRRAIGYLHGLPSVAGRPIGLVGFSRGAFLAVSVAAMLPEVKAAVDFYGGGGGGIASLEDEAKGFPPLLILHGEADNIVPVDFALKLRDAVLASGGSVEVHLYPGAGHAFNASDAPTYSEEAARDSLGRTVDFLKRKLKR
jgi:carboxymethylenebutenolidase